MSTPGHGGYRPPTNPAPISGPGAMSARTDGGVMNPASPSYGEVADVNSLKQAAPMAPSAQASPQAAPVDPTASVVGLSAPTQRPDVPVTDGAALGPGQGTSALGIPQSPSQLARADVQALGPGFVQAIIASAQRVDAPPSVKALARAVVFAQ